MESIEELVKFHEEFIKKAIEEMADVEFYKIMLIEVLGFSEENFTDMVDDKLRENIRRMEERKCHL